VGVGEVEAPTSRPTWVVAVEELLVWFGSASLPFTVPVLLTVPGNNPAVTATATVAEPPEGMEPRSQVTTPADWLQLPCVELTETNVTPEGRGSVSVAAVAVLGPLFVTTRL